MNQVSSIAALSVICIHTRIPWWWRRGSEGLKGKVQVDLFAHVLGVPSLLEILRAALKLHRAA